MSRGPGFASFECNRCGSRQTSAATFKNDEFFSGSGIVSVIPEPSATTMLLGGFSALLGLQRFRRRN